MQSRSSKSIVRRFLVILFLSSLIGSLWLGHLPGPNWQVGLGVVTAQSPDASQLVQQSVALYQAGNYRGAIAPWQTALSFYQKTNNRASEAIVWERSINDASTVTFVTEFYQDWHGKKMSKAAALGAAQRSLIEARGDYAHPYYWAPFILIGNWL